MRRLILAVIFWVVMAAGAHAACPGVMADCPNPPNTKAEIAPIGIKADGVTSDDVALKAVVDQCAANGGRLKLRAGRILLPGAATITLNNCYLEGTGIPAGKDATVPSQGTMILLTSTTVKPFVIGSDWAISGINFFWPNQTTGTQAALPRAGI